MYELNPLWENYYNELKPDKRKKMLKELISSGEDDGANGLRQKLLKKRHTDPKDPGHQVDMFLMECAYLPSLYRKRKFFLVNMKNEIKRTKAHLCLDDVDKYTEMEKIALYWELRNAAKRYFKTCTGSRYGNRLMCISKATEDEKVRLAGRDAWQMSAGIARYCWQEKEMAIFCDAVKDAYVDYFEDGQEIFEHFAEKFKDDEPMRRK